MPYNFEIEQLLDILRECPEYAPGHHLGRPFMSAYQISISFAERFPEHPAVTNLGIGGMGTGAYESLAQQIARYLSQEISRETDRPIEGGFIAHQNIDQFSFNSPGGSDPIQVSTLRSERAHSIFRYTGA